MSTISFFLRAFLCAPLSAVQLTGNSERDEETGNALTYVTGVNVQIGGSSGNPREARAVVTGLNLDF